MPLKSYLLIPCIFSKSPSGIQCDYHSTPFTKRPGSLKNLYLQKILFFFFWSPCSPFLCSFFVKCSGCHQTKGTRGPPAPLVFAQLKAFSAIASAPTLGPPRFLRTSKRSGLRRFNCPRTCLPPLILFFRSHSSHPAVPFRLVLLLHSGLYSPSLPLNVHPS